MKRFLAGFTACLALVGLAAWIYNQREDALAQSSEWFQHDSQTFRMNGEIGAVNIRIYEEYTGIQKIAETINAPAMAGATAQLYTDAQGAKDVTTLLAYLTFDVDLLQGLRGYPREKLGKNLIHAGFKVDSLVDDTNIYNDLLIRLDKDMGGLAPGLKPLLADLRRDLDEIHVIASRLKCESEPSKPTHLYVPTP